MRFANLAPADPTNPSKDWERAKSVYDRAIFEFPGPRLGGPNFALAPVVPLIRIEANELPIGANSPTPEKRVEEVYRVALWLRAVFSDLVAYRVPRAAELGPRGPVISTPGAQSPGGPSIELSANGRIRITEAPLTTAFFHALDGTTLSQVRLCPVCKDIFLAARKDKAACSPACSTVENARRLRRREKEKRYTTTRTYTRRKKARARKQE